MGNSKFVKDISTKIEANKEILATMPQNNAKNRERYLNKVQELLDEFQKYQIDIEEILKQRYKRSIENRENKEIKMINGRIKTINDLLFLLSDIKNSYEKMGLDKNIYKLSKYYKENLESVNNQIAVCLDSFKNVGIELKLDDFNYSTYVTEYMNTFLQEYKNYGNINSKQMKKKFDDIYWKCPEIIMQIELNFRYLYLKNKGLIDKYFEKEKSDLLVKWQRTPESIMKNYLELEQKKIEIESSNKKMIIENFISGKLNTKNFTTEKIVSNCTKILPEELANKALENKEIQNNIFKFLNSLYEYKNYMNYKFLVDEIKKSYNDRQQYKKSYDDTRKKIEKDDKKLKKINKKIARKGFWIFKPNNTKNIEMQGKILQGMKDDYRNLDLNEFYQKMYDTLKDDSTIFDVLELASSYYNFVIMCMIKNDKNITQDEMDVQVDGLKDFLISPYNTIITNVKFLEDKDIALIIKDRYKLLNFNIEKEDISMNNVDSLISLLENVQTGICINNAGVDISDVEDLLNIKKLFKL